MKEKIKIWRDTPKGMKPAYYRFQTVDKKVANKMKRRKGFELVSEGFNCDFWIYRKEFSSKYNADRSKKSLLKGK